jgi:hypothetical protein
MDLDATFHLPEAGLYPYARDAKVPLPLPYGDFLSTTAVPDDDDDGGFLPAVEIDRINCVYALSLKPVPASPAPQIYVGDWPEPQNPSVYTWVPEGDYFGLGIAISYVQFHFNPGGSPVSWRGYGIKNQTTGQLITNPLDAIADAFCSLFGGFTLENFDWATCFETFRTLTELGAQIRWCFSAQKTYREWLTEILRCYHVNHFETTEGKLAMVLDRAILGLSVSVPYTIDAQTDLVGTEDDVEFEVDESNICNTLTVKRRYKWTTGDYTDEPTVDHRPSVGVYGTLRGEVELPAIYTDADGLVWVRAFFSRYSHLPAIVRFTVRGMGYVTALPGSYLGFVWPWMGWTQARLLLVLNQEADPFGMSVSIEAFDCGRFVTDAVTLPTVSIEEVRRRIRVTVPTCDLTPPGPATGITATGNYREIVVRWTPPGDLDYDYTEIWASQTNNRATATFFRNGGYKGTKCEETFKVAEGSTWYVWLMTVDRDGNGENGGTGVTGGNWAPAGATAGVQATATLVDTLGMNLQAVTFTNVTFARSPFQQYIGEYPMAYCMLNGLYTQGDVIVFGTIVVTIQPSSLLICRIKRGSEFGEMVGISYFTNPFGSQATLRVDCWAMDFNPSWNGMYVITAQHFLSSGADAVYQLFSAELYLRQTKR